MSDKKVSFRDRPINMDSEGHRNWIYTKKTSGKWYSYRTYFSWLWIAFFILAPIIKINGHNFMLLDIVNRKFIIFGVIFWAQDTFILALLMLSFVLFIIVFTVTYGRIWCGWACPQTIFLEMIYRKIEHLIEGDYRARYKRDKGAWNANKIFRKVLKHSVFIFISILITNIFLMWFTGAERLLELIRSPINEHTTGFTAMLIVSAIFYWIYAYFREQICTMICPYGRMQGVLLDSKSIIVAYDYKRGEPRGAKNEGDCIACQQCVSVCPTGIDIKDGTQLECINCTACIDECNMVMKKINKPTGLIRFDSIEGIEKGHKTIWNARNKAYSVILALLFSFFIFTLLTRPSVETTILRTPGTLYQEQGNNKISNIYNIKIVNKSHEEKILTLKLISHKGEIKMAGKEIRLKDQDLYESAFVLILGKSELAGDNTRIKFGIFEGEELLETYELSFVGP